MRFALNIVYTKNGKKNLYIGLLLESEISIDEIKTTLTNVVRKFYNHNGEEFAFEFLKEVKSFPKFQILVEHIPEGEYVGTAYYQPMFSIDARDGIYLEYHEYLFSCDPFF